MAQKTKKRRPTRVKKTDITVVKQTRQKYPSYEDWKPFMPDWLMVIRKAVDQGELIKAKELLKELLVEEVIREKLAVHEIDIIFFIYYEISILCFVTELHQKALEYCLKAVKIKPVGGIYNQIGLIYRSMNKCTLAIENLQKAKELEPEELNICNNLALCLMKVGRSEEAIDLFRQGVQKDPHHKNVYSNLLLHLNYMPGITPEKMYEESKKWAEIQVPASRAWTDHENIPDPHRRLRIGYISPDFRHHSVMFFFNPLLLGHDRENFELFGYGNVEGIDSVTRRTATKFDYYHNIKGMEDKAVAELIRADKIDILVEMAGHTKGNSLGALSYKPAPIQVSYMGYPATTGMSQIDYRFTDAIADTPDQQKYYTEKLVFLPNGFLCYDPGGTQLPIKDQPALSEKHITFGCSNNISKLNPEMMKLWVQILNAVPGSKIILKFAEGADQQVKNYYYDQFEALGLKESRERVAILGWLPHAKHVELYNYIDIALDTYPYNGTTTTCQALVMGVPVITLTGKHHSSRVGLDILSRLDMQFFSAQSPEEYVKKAVVLASKPEAIAKIRANMRQRMTASTLCCYKMIANDIENEYRKMWHHWCSTQKNVQINTPPKTEKKPEIIVDDLTFTNITTTQAKDISVGFNDEYIIKIEHGKHPWKLRTFAEEVEIIKHLNESGCVSCPKLVSEGNLRDGQRYFIQERIHNRGGFNIADMMFSILEQKSFAVCQGDFKRDNFIFGNDSVCHIIDYDQALYDERIRDMGNLEYLEWFNDFFVKRWNELGLKFKDIYSFGGFSKEDVLRLFKGDALNLARASVFEEQVTTNTETGIYHTLESDKIFIDGCRGLEHRTAALDTIEFKPGEKVLDVGCNMGLLGHYLHDRGCKVTGIDMDEKIITGAQMVANILGKDIRFRYLDVDNNRIEEDYDTICLFSVIHHVANFEQVTANIAERCNRIILECRLQETGSKPIQGRWCRSSGWNFNCSHELIEYLQKVFKGFKFQQHHGNVDRQREIMTFVKEPAYVVE